MSSELIDQILLLWVPSGFGIIGILIFLLGVIKLVTGKEKAFDNIFSGILIFLIGIGLRFVFAFALDQLQF